MSKTTLSRRNVLRGATVAAAAINVPSAAQAAQASPELLAIHERILAARAERDRLQKLTNAAQSKRPPIPAIIEREGYPGLHVRPTDWRRRGYGDRAAIAEAYEASVASADRESGYLTINAALEAQFGIVTDAELEMVNFEPRSVADLRMQIELAIHQEVVDRAMFDVLPMLIFQRALRLTA